jgi:phage baseplate assembly protein W
MAGRLSDFNPRPNYYSELTAINNLFGDIDLRLLINSNTGDIQKYTDIDAIKYALKNLVLSNFYERPFKPFIAGNVTGLLFENPSVLVSIQLKESITQLITRYERRVDLLSVNVSSKLDSNEYNVSITFKIKNVVDTTEFSIKRYR